MVHARAWSAWPGAIALLLAPAAHAGITGVCPDGSIFIVQRAADVPCRDAREVEPDEVPPLKAEFLPRPYAWQLFQKQQDPNNPYNLVETGRRVREAGQAGLDAPAVGTPPLEAAPLAAQSQPAPSEAPGATPPQTAMVRRAPEANVAGGLGFSEQEIRDLFLIVELSQQRAPATFAPEADVAVVLRVAQSRAFDQRLREERAQNGTPPRGAVVLFSAIAEAEAAFHANLTFVQGHVAFQPDPDDPEQIGVLYGRLGPLAPREAVLGYVVLPERLDPAQPMDIYWNDRRLTATLRP
jgi:hypothetical protein